MKSTNVIFDGIPVIVYRSNNFLPSNRKIKRFAACFVVIPRTTLNDIHPTMIVGISYTIIATTNRNGKNKKQFLIWIKSFMQSGFWFEFLRLHFQVNAFYLVWIEFGCLDEIFRFHQMQSHVKGLKHIWFGSNQNATVPKMASEKRKEHERKKRSQTAWSYGGHSNCSHIILNAYFAPHVSESEMCMKCLTMEIGVSAKKCPIICQ